MIADDDGPAQRKMPYGFWKLRRMMAAATPSRIETCKDHGSQHRICVEGVCGKKWLPARRLCFAGVSGKKWLTAQPGSIFDLDAFDVVDPYSGEFLCKLRDMLPGSALPSSSWMSKPSTPIALPTPGASRRSRPRAPPPSRT